MDSVHSPSSRFPLRRQPAVLLVLLAALVLSLAPPPAAAQQDVMMVLGKGVQIPVEFEPFCLPAIEDGSLPVARVAQDIMVSSKVVVAKGAEVTLEVAADALKPNGRGGKPGSFTLDLKTVSAVDGTQVQLGGDGAHIEKKGKGRGFFGKLFTLWLGRGEDPCIGPQDVFRPEVAKDYQIVVPNN